MQDEPLNRRHALARLGALALGSLSTAAQAHDFRVGSIVIDHPYAVAGAAVAPNGAAYFRTLVNNGDKADRLLSAHSSVSRSVELHEMKLDGEVMRMRPLEALDLPAHSRLELRHGGRWHLMLVGLERPLKLGDRFSLTLRFEQAGEIEVKVWVQQPRDALKREEHAH